MYQDFCLVYCSTLARKILRGVKRFPPRRWKRKFGERVAGWIAATVRRLIVSQINRTRRFLPHCDDKAPCMFIGCLHHRDARCASRANNVAWTECSCLFFFAAFLIRTVASVPREKERDFWSSPKDRRIKISRLFDETVTPLSLFRPLSLFFFLFLLLMKSDEWK